MNKTLWIVISVIILATLGYWAYNSNNALPSLTSPTNEAPTSPDNIQPAGDSTNIDTANWKTYRDEKYAFEVRYPDNWFLQQSIGKTSDGDILHIDLSNIPYSAREGFSCPSEMAAVIFDVGLQKSTAQSFENFVRSRVASLDEPGWNGPAGQVTPTSLAGHASFQIERSGWKGCAGPGYFVEYTPENYTLVAVLSDTTNQQVVNAILSTFKFTK